MSIEHDPYYKGERKEMLHFVSGTPKRVLDIGCGIGGFGAMLKDRYGCEAWGIELNPDAAAIAQRRLDRVLCGDASSLATELPHGCFDIIACNDVLEHLPNPDNFLAEIRVCLAPQGAVIASVPNIRYFRALKTILAGDFPWEPDGIFDCTHLRFFTFKSARALFENAGYQVDCLQGINPARGFKLSAAIAFSLGRLADVRFLQIAIRARA